MERMGILDVNNAIHISVLHFAFGPQIQRDLDQWRLTHNNHPVRTEKHETPNQLWHKRVYLNRSTMLTVIQNIYQRSPVDVDNFIGYFFRENNLNEPTDIAIVLPTYAFPLTQAEEVALSTEVDVLTISDCFGIDIYANVLGFVKHCISSQGLVV